MMTLPARIARKQKQAIITTLKNTCKTGKKVNAKTHKITYRRDKNSPLHECNTQSRNEVGNMRLEDTKTNAQS